MDLSYPGNLATPPLGIVQDGVFTVEAKSPGKPGEPPGLPAPSPGSPQAPSRRGRHRPRPPPAAPGRAAA